MSPCGRRVSVAASVVVDRADDVRDELHVAPRGQAQAAQLAGHRHAVEVVAARHRRQEDLLVLPPDVAHHVDAPRALRRPGCSAASCSGMANSASQPRSVISRADGPVGVPVGVEPADLAALRSAAARATAARAAVWPSPITWPSSSIPNGLVPKTNAFCPSLNVSRRIWIESVSFRSASRRLWVTMILSARCRS